MRTRRVRDVDTGREETQHVRGRRPGAKRIATQLAIAIARDGVTATTLGTVFDTSSKRDLQIFVCQVAS